MSRVILLWSILLFLVTPLLSQPKPLFGANVGISVGDQVWETGPLLNTTVLQPRMGVLVAGSMEFFHQDQLSLLTELGYVQKGSKLEMEILDDSNPLFGLDPFTLEYNVDYIHWWAAVKFKAMWDQFQPYFFAGPRIDVQISSDVVLPLEGVDKVSTIYGGVIGLGFQYKPKKKNYVIFVQGNYLADFSDLHFTNPTFRRTSVNVRNSAITLSAGVKTKIIYSR